MPNVLQFGMGRYGKFHRTAWELSDVNYMWVDPNVDLEGITVTELDWDWADIVDIVTPVNAHVDLVVEAGSRGKTVFCEKPLGMDPDQLRFIAGKQWPVYMGYGYRFAKNVQYLRERRDAIRSIDIQFLARKEPRKDTDILWSDGVHCLDLLAYLSSEDLVVPGRLPLQWDEARRTVAYRGGRVSFTASNNRLGIFPDPVIPGAHTTKHIFVEWKDGLETKHTFHQDLPVDLLTAQFSRLLSGDVGELATVEESIGIAEVLQS